MYNKEIGGPWGKQGRNGEIIARAQVGEDGGLDMGDDNGSGKNRNT